MYCPAAYQWQCRGRARRRCPRKGDATVQFNHRFTTAGERQIHVQVAPDRLALDNSRWLVVPVRNELRVLCVAGHDGAAKYVADALNPNPEAAGSPIRPVVISDGDFADATLADFDCIFFCNVPQLTANEAARVARFTSAGGGVVFFLGDRVVPDSYNKLVVSTTGERTVAAVDPESTKVGAADRPFLPAHRRATGKLSVRCRPARLPSPHRRTVPRPRAIGPTHHSDQPLLSTRIAREKYVRSRRCDADWRPIHRNVSRRRGANRTRRYRRFPCIR